VQDIARRSGAVFVADEVQSGIRPDWHHVRQ
jgi:4-aminobutyrate aminotransferase-like enzyme